MVTTGNRAVVGLVLLIQRVLRIGCRGISLYLFDRSIERNEVKGRVIEPPNESRRLHV